MARLFIAYPFQPGAQAIVDSLIRPVLRRQGIQCVTGVDKERRRDVVESLRETIASCSALVAVVTGSNPNVFFEIGIASTLAKPCLLLASAESDAAMLQDTYPVITITSAEHAMHELGCHLSNLRHVQESASATV
jgi:nucleoside 2-deoxyribosyltransferase